MPVSQIQYEKINAFLDGDLNEEAIVGFLLEVEKDAALAAALEHEMLLRNMLQQKDSQPVAVPFQLTELEASDVHLAHVKQIITGQDRKKEKSLLVWMRGNPWKAAAIAALLMIAAFGLVQLSAGNHNKKGQQEMADGKRDTAAVIKQQPLKMRDSIPNKVRPSVIDTQQPAKAPDTMLRNIIKENDISRYRMDRDDEPMASIIVAELVLENDPAAALQESYESFELRGEKPVDSKLWHYLCFYRGLCFSALNQQDSAGYYFRAVIDAVPATEPVHAKAIFYLALQQLKAGKKEECIALLQRLDNADSDKRYRQRAAALLKRLR